MINIENYNKNKKHLSPVAIDIVEDIIAKNPNAETFPITFLDGFFSEPHVTDVLEYYEYYFQELFLAEIIDNKDYEIIKTTYKKYL